MADSAVNLGAGGFTDFSSMSMDEMMFGAPAGLDTLRRTRPSYDEYGMAYRFVGDEAVPFIDDEGYRVDLGSSSRDRYRAAAEGMEINKERVTPYEGHSPSLFDRDIQRQFNIDRSDQPIGFENGGIASVMPVNKPLLSDRDAAVGGKLLKLAGIQQGPNEVMSGLGPDLLDQVSRILGRKIG